METEWPYQKINAVNWLSILKYPYEYQCLFIIWGKNIGTWKLLHSHNFGHVTWKLWVGLPVEFISLVVLKIYSCFHKQLTFSEIKVAYFHTGAYIHPKSSRFTENRQKPSCVWTEKWPKTYEEAELAQNRGQDSACLETPITTFCLTMLIDLIFLNF